MARRTPAGRRPQWLPRYTRPPTVTESGARKADALHRLGDPALAAVWRSRCSPRSVDDDPAPSVHVEPAHVLVGEERQGGVRRPLRERAHGVPDRGPVRAVVGGDLESVGGRRPRSYRRGSRSRPRRRTATRGRAGRRSSSSRSARRRSRAPSRCRRCRTRSDPEGRSRRRARSPRTGPRGSYRSGSPPRQRPRSAGDRSPGHTCRPTGYPLGSRAAASTCTPQPELSGMGGSGPWAAAPRGSVAASMARAKERIIEVSGS